MHERFLEVTSSRSFILHGAEASKAFIANIRFHRVEAHDNHVDAEIEFDAIEKERFVEVTLDKQVFLVHQTVR